MASTWSAVKKLVRNSGVNLGKSTSVTAIKTTDSGVFVHPIGRDDKVAFLVKWTSSATARSCQLTVAAGDKWQGSKGALNYTLTSTDAGKEYLHILGPFESARFAKASTYSTASGAKKGGNVLTVTGVGYKTTGTTTHASSAAQKANIFYIKPFTMPEVSL